MKLFIRYSLVILTFLISTSSLRAEFSDTTTLPSEQEINSENYGDDNAKYHILWLHSERGVNKNLRSSVKNITENQSIKVILPDFHDSYFIPKSRLSLEKIPQQDIEDYIVELAQDIAPKKLYVFAMSRSAGMVLKAAQSLQLKKNNPIAAALSF